MKSVIPEYLFRKHQKIQTLEGWGRCMTIKYGREMVLIRTKGRKPLLLGRELGLGESFA